MITLGVSLIFSFIIYDLVGICSATEWLALSNRLTIFDWKDARDGFRLILVSK
jgi:uncharacterized membrane protein YuzA (DUF378 family)